MNNYNWWHATRTVGDSALSEYCSSALNGERVIGPWVLGLFQNQHNVRYCVMPDRKASTLNAAIKQHVQRDSVIHTDEWRGYCQLNANGFLHNIVNHSKHFIDPVTGVDIQGVERTWIEEKLWLRRTRRPRLTMPLALNEVSWRRLRTDPSTACDLFVAFLKDLAALEHNIPMNMINNI